MEITSPNIIIDAIKAIEENTKLFYQQKAKEGYEMLNHTLALLTQTIDLLKKSPIETDSLYIDEKLLNGVLTDAIKALEYGDTILFSDILYFDLIPLFEQYI